MSNILIIDSTKGMNEKNSSLHVRNSYILKNYLDADLIGSEPKYIDSLTKSYNRILFVSSSGYTEVSYFVDWILNNHNNNVSYYYICNDYNVGEPVLLWILSSKNGIKYNVIANHKGEENKKLRGVNLKERIENWDIVNLNSLIYDHNIKEHKNSISSFFNTDFKKTDIIYFGAFRKGRVKYFKKYIDNNFPLSTSKKNYQKYNENGIHGFWNKRLNWYGSINTLHNYKSSLYIEDEATHEWYSCLANRYYEALSYNIPSFFDLSCMNTIRKSGYPIDHFFIVNSKEELWNKIRMLDNYDYDLSEEKEMARQEKEETLKKIKEIIC